MRRALAGLTASLNRIRDVAADMDTRILRATPEERKRDETLRCSCTVILSGFFESFLKDCTEAFISSVSARRVPFTSLPKQIQRRHFVEGGALLGQKMMSKGQVSWIVADHLDMVRRLASPAAGSVPYLLLWEAYAITQGNPRPEVVEKILEGLGVDNRQPRMDQALGGAYATQRLVLDLFIDVRNECAHTGTAAKIPSTADLRNYCDTIGRIAAAFVRVLESRLSEAPFGININKATALELRKIPRFGSARINALVNYRNTSGGITRIEELSNIPGFGPTLIDHLRLYLHV